MVKAQSTSYRFAQQVKEQLEKTSCPILGVILNEVDITKQGYGQYGKYGKYGQYGRYGQYGHRVSRPNTGKKSRGSGQYAKPVQPDAKANPKEIQS